MIFNIIFGVLCVGCGILYSYRSYKDYKAFFNFKRKNLGEYRCFLKTLCLIQKTNKKKDLLNIIEAVLYFNDSKFEKCFKLYRSRVGRREWRPIQRVLDDINKL